MIVGRWIVLAVRLLALTGVIAKNLHGPVGLTDTLFERFALFAGEVAADLVRARRQDLRRFVKDRRARIGDVRRQPSAAP